MRTLRRGSRGISEIVGALMLVLIVVVAATSLAIFVAQYQKQLQSQEALTHARNLEDLTVLHVAPYLPVGDTTSWASLNFTIASLFINPAQVDEITVNDQPVKKYTAWVLNLTTGAFDSTVVGINGNYQLNLTPREQVNVNITFTPMANSSFYNPSYVLSITNFVEINLFTSLQNDFNRIFIPPTAIALVTPLQTFNGTQYVTVPVLDGSNSFQAGNASIDSWQWYLNSTGHPNATASGERVVVTLSSTPSTLYNIVLVVSDTDGLKGTDEITYTT